LELCCGSGPVGYEIFGQSETGSHFSDPQHRMGEGGCCYWTFCIIVIAGGVQTYMLQIMQAEEYDFDGQVMDLDDPDVAEDLRLMEEDK
jgi:hypothetical protein